MANKTHQLLNHFRLRTSAMAVASCLVFSGLPLVAHAVGLGKIVVFSALGQNLRAEIEVSATREELNGMKVQIASHDAFEKAGVDYATTLRGIGFSLDKRPNGQSVIKLSSERPINEPFVDMLLELNWPTGRLVREYTFLLDPPEISAKGAAPVASASVEPVAARDSLEESSQKVESSRGRLSKSVQKPVDTFSEGRNVREVKRGDTLKKIASETKPEGVSLDQMLVGLLRANQEAFDDGNMNRLKAGKILSVPEKSAIEAVSTDEARKIVLAQYSDWNVYRNKLAGVAAQARVSETTSKQDVSGKITAKVEEKATLSAESKDQLKVSKTELTTAAKAGATSTRSEEGMVAKEKALREANERLAALEKNVVDLQKLVELKNQNLAELQAQAASKHLPVEAKKPSAEGASPQPSTSAPVSPPSKVESAPVAAVVEKPVVEPAKANSEVVAAKPEPKVEPGLDEKTKPKTALPPPSPNESGFVEEMIDNPLPLALGGGLLALIATFFVVRRRRASKEEMPLDLSSTLSPQNHSLMANSVFRSMGGQSVDTSSNTPVHTDFSQAGPGSIDTDEVDPVAEADVYMAYGRDVQAEEILLEAKQKDPKRYAIYLKLLEIYSNRKDVKLFEALATDLYSETGGIGADWEKAAEMGIKLDPDNPLYGTSAQAVTTEFDADATVIASSPLIKSTVALPGELSQFAEVASHADEPVLPPVTPVASEEPTSLDFDLGLDNERLLGVPDIVDTGDAFKLPKSAVDAGALDFDLSSDNSDSSDSDFAKNADAVGLDFDLSDISTAGTSLGGMDEKVADLDFDLGFESHSAAFEKLSSEPQQKLDDVSSVVSVADDQRESIEGGMGDSSLSDWSMPEPSQYDMSSISLDLEMPDSDVSTPASLPVAEIGSSLDLLSDDFQVPTPHNSDSVIDSAATIVNPQFGAEVELDPEFEIATNEEVMTKLDLAKAYEEMGDFEGARELLQEVMKEGDATHREKAKAILAKIGE